MNTEFWTIGETYNPQEMPLNTKGIRNCIKGSDHRL